MTSNLVSVHAPYSLREIQSLIRQWVGKPISRPTRNMYIIIRPPQGGEGWILPEVLTTDDKSENLYCAMIVVEFGDRVCEHKISLNIGRFNTTNPSVSIVRDINKGDTMVVIPSILAAHVWNYLTEMQDSLYYAGPCFNSDSEVVGYSETFTVKGVL